MVLLGVGEDGRSPVRERKTGGELEEETELVRNCSPGADLLQRRQQHGEDVQLTGGTHLLYLFKKKTLQNNDTIDGENFCHVSTDPAEEQHSGKYCG